MWGVYLFINLLLLLLFLCFSEVKIFLGGIVDKITLAKLEPLIIYAREHLNRSVDYR